MEDMYSHYEGQLRAVLQELGFEPEACTGITLTPPREAAHGDMATNAALILANRTKQKPREMAVAIAEKLKAVLGVESVSVAGAGFINLVLKPEVWQSVVVDILAQGDAYGASQLGAGKKINIEFVSANPTGPLHIGHARGAIFGDCLAALMENAGYIITREYYVNDEGAQMQVLVDSLRARFQNETPGEGLYPGEYLIKIAAGLASKKNDDDEALSRAARDAIMEVIVGELSQLNIKFDVFTHESALHAKSALERTLSFLEKKELVYRGTLPPPKKGVPEDWEAEEQLLFRSTNFGDDSDRTIKKADGRWTYFAGDMAYHHDKIERGFDELVNVFGADHGGYVKRLRAVVDALSDKKIRLSVPLMHLVRVVEKGEAKMMSKRAGNFIGLQELINEIGADALRFVMLTRKHDAPLDIDLVLLKEQSNDNPVFYVQYAHARCCSVLGQSAMVNKTLTATLHTLTHLDELALLKLLAQFPQVCADAAREKTPHNLAFYLLKLAGHFHTLWNRGNENDSLKFLSPDVKIQEARLGLVLATKQTLNRGLKLMGVKPKEELR